MTPARSKPLLFQSVLFSAAILGTFLLSSCGLLGLAASAGMIKLQFGCLPEGTLIDTPEGPTPIESLATGDRVIGYDGSPVVVTQIHQYQEDPEAVRHLVVRFDDGAKIPLSSRHRIAGIPAGDLSAGDPVENRVVTSVSPLGGVRRSFDLLTEDTGYQIGGVPVNSMIEEMAGR